MGHLLLEVIVECLNLVDIGLESLFILPANLITFIMLVIALCKTLFEKSKNSLKIGTKIAFIPIAALIIIIPVLILAIPFKKELYIINNSDYILMYNYQDGIIISKNTYIALFNGKAGIISLKYRPKNEKNANVSHYTVVYGDEVEIRKYESYNNYIEIQDERIKNIAIDVQKRVPSAKSLDVDYFRDKDYVLVEALSEVGYGSVLEESLYYQGKYVQKIHTSGSLKTIKYYD